MPLTTLNLAFHAVFTPAPWIVHDALREHDGMARWLCIVCFALCGCAEMAAAGLEGLSRQRACRGPVKCGYDAERAAVAERYRASRDQQILAYEKLLTSYAVDAARAGQCATVRAVRERLLAMGDDDGMSGNFHDTVFLQHAAILDCLASKLAPGAIGMAPVP
jgi:hypothetical protein